MKRSVLLLLAFLPMLGFGQGWLSSVTLSNSTPNGCDPVTVTINGTQQCLNSVVSYSGHTISGNTVTINVDDQLGPICLPALVTFAVTTPGIILPAGTTTVKVNLTWNGSPQASMQISVSVAGGGAMTQNIQICTGDSLFVGGAYQTQAGAYTDTLFGVSCDTVITTNLSFKNFENITRTLDICEGESVFLEGALQSTPGVYFDTIVMTEGCDTAYATTLMVHALDSTFKSVSICEGEVHYAGGANQSTSGIYYDGYLNAKGCDSTLVTDLTVVVPPAKPSVQPYGTDSLESSEIGDFYDWFFNGVKMGVHSRRIALDFYGNYEVAAYLEGCVTDTSDVYEALDPSFGMEEHVIEFKMYPNPVSEVLHIEGQNLQSITIYDYRGRAILKEDVQGHAIDIAVNHLSLGMYIVEITDLNGLKESESLQLID